MTEHSESDRRRHSPTSPIPPGLHRRLVRRVLAVALLAGLAPGGSPSGAFPRGVAEERRFEFEVRELVFAGLRGEEGALERALARCEEALEADPENWEALVWRGSTKVGLSGEAYRAGDFQAGQGLWDAGIAEMRRAAEAAPDRIEVLIPRAATLLGSAAYHPFPAERERLFDVALSSYVRVFELQRPYFDRMSDHARGELLMSLADAHLRVGRWEQAEPYLRRAVDTLFGTTYGEEASRLLALETRPERVRTCHGCHPPEEAR